MTEHARVIRIAKFRPDPGRRQELLARLRELADVLRPLPGLFGVQVCTLHEDNEWLVLVSRWHNEDAMKAQGNEAIAAILTSLAGLVEREEIEHLLSL